MVRVKEVLTWEKRHKKEDRFSLNPGILGVVFEIGPRFWGSKMKI